MISAAITPPKTYSEWVDVLNKLKTMEDDEAVLSAMQRGTVEWQIGVAERFSKKLIDVINYRMNAASDKFQKEIKRSNGQERVIVQALLAFLIRSNQSSRNSGKGQTALLSVDN